VQTKVTPGKEHMGMAKRGLVSLECRGITLVWLDLGAGLFLIHGCLSVLVSVLLCWSGSLREGCKTYDAFLYQQSTSASFFSCSSNEMAF